MLLLHNRHMTAFVMGWLIREDEELAEVDPRPAMWKENVDVGYSSTPVLRIKTRHEADLDCERLRRMRVHVGAHYCEFGVEELPEGDFTLVCFSHPDHLRVVTPEN